MMKDKELEALLDRIEKSSFSSFELERDNFRVKVEKNITNTVASSNGTGSVYASNYVEVDNNITEVKAPFVGVVYLAPAEDKSDYVKKGDNVTPDRTVCLIEAMKTFNEVHATVDGQICEILVENGSLVEFDQPLFKIKTGN